MRKSRIATLVPAMGLAALLSLPAAAADLTISAALSQVHFWVGQHMDPFADAVEKETNGDIEFTRFYAGELVSIGRGLDGLNSGTIDVAAPLLAPYHEGRFPLSDVTQLPTYGTDSPMITRAFQKLLDSDRELGNGKTFYQYEIADKGIRVWALGATAPYAISSTGKELKRPDDFKGLPMRAGSRLHTIVLQQLGVTPVTMPAAQAYEALTRGTIDGIILSIGDWKSYSMTEILRYTITGVAIGHWESYLAISDAAWNRLSSEQQRTWDRLARQAALDNARAISAQDETVRQAASKHGAAFVDVDELPAAMRAHIAKAATDTWIQWIEQTESAGHPARATAVLWAELVQAEGGKLPDGVARYLGL